MLIAPVAAQSAPATETDGRQIYPRSFFDPFNPQTARDMIDRLPGFTLNAGDDLRGFGGSAGNVLIDGARPANKSGGIEDALRRIPANDVDRIEVIRGAAGAGEAQGQSIVANIIRAGRDRSISWKAEIERNSEGVTYPRVEGSLTARLGDWTTSTKLNGFWEQFDVLGRRDRLGPDGALVTAQVDDRPSVLTQGFAANEASRALGGGKLTINTRFGYSGFFQVTDRFQFDAREPDAAPDGRVYIDFDSVEWTGEASADWTRPVGGDWTLKAIALGAIRPLDELTVTRRERPVAEIASRSVFTNRQTPIETIVRTTLSRGGARRLKPEFGVEAAFNRLDSLFTLTNIDVAGVETPVVLPSSDVVVQELRGEAFANLIFAANSALTVETGVAGEVSRISVSGDTENSQTFVFAKPFASVLYQATPSTQVRFTARRSVGQLDFGDFAASAVPELDQEFAGNPELGPDQSTRLSAAIDWRNETRGAINIELFHEWREDVLEQVALASGAFGLANAGSGRVWGLVGSASLKLTPFLPGGLLEARATIQDSSFDDPLTGQTRSLTNIVSPRVTVNFRQDLPSQQVSWGAAFVFPEDDRAFFGNEISDFRTGDELSLFVETTRFLGVKSRLMLKGVGGRDFIGRRTFFSPDRAGGITGFEASDRKRGMFVTLTVEGQS